MLHNGLKHAWWVLVVAGMAACDGSSLTEPEEGIVSPSSTTDCISEVAFSLDALCSSHGDDVQEPIAHNPDDGTDKTTKGGKDQPTKDGIDSRLRE